MILRDIIAGGCRRTGITGSGTSVFERDWDVLVILDACRSDIYADIVGSTETYQSPASMSERWMSRTFCEEYLDEMSNTAYITGNPFSKNLSSDDFALLDEVWKYAWTDRGTVRAETMVDRAIDVARNRDDDRIIVHMMQPHEPFIAEGSELGSSTLANFGGDAEEIGLNIWEEVSIGIQSEQEVREAYRSNLEYALEHVETLLDNVNGEVVLTSDHGNALGKWGLWGHPSDIPLSCLRTVPWDKRVCEDSHSYAPPSKNEYATQSVDETVEDRLEQLGYTR